MAQIIIEGVPPHDGSYELDPSTFNGRELRTIKELSGVRAGELEEAFAAGDYDLVVAMTVIALRRAGKVVDPEEILDAAVGAITVDASQDEVGEDEERPPVTATPGGSSSSAGGVANGNAGTPSSGEPSTADGDDPVSPLRSIGSLG